MRSPEESCSLGRLTKEMFCYNIIEGILYFRNNFWNYYNCWRRRGLQRLWIEGILINDTIWFRKSFAQLLKTYKKYKRIIIINTYDIRLRKILIYYFNKLYLFKRFFFDRKFFSKNKINLKFRYFEYNFVYKYFLQIF